MLLGAVHIIRHTILGHFGPSLPLSQYVTSNDPPSVFDVTYFEMFRLFDKIEECPCLKRDVTKTRAPPSLVTTARPPPPFPLARNDYVNGPLGTERDSFKKFCAAKHRSRTKRPERDNPVTITQACSFHVRELYGRIVKHNWNIEHS